PRRPGRIRPSFPGRVAPRPWPRSISWAVISLRGGSWTRSTTGGPMEWRDEGVVLGVKKHGETSAIGEALTRTHGRHLGLVRGGRSARFRSLLQPGNSLDIVWRARLDEHLGTYAVEPLNLRAGRLMRSALALSGLAYLGALLRLLPERD